jgi:hypothetical protein
MATKKKVNQNFLFWIHRVLYSINVQVHIGAIKPALLLSPHPIVVQALDKASDLPGSRVPTA